MMEKKKAHFMQCGIAGARTHARQTKSETARKLLVKTPVGCAVVDGGGLTGVSREVAGGALTSPG